MDEKQWIREIQQGKKEYLQDIAMKYYDDIYRFCCYQTGNSQDAYDLAQETFLRFIKYVEHYRYRNLKGYLLTIAMNVCRDYFTSRNRKKEFFMEEAEDMESPLQKEKEPEVLTEQKDRTQRLLTSLGALPQMQREAIILHYFYALKSREIARLTGAGNATVKSRIRQGMDKLRGMLREEDFYDT